MWKNHCILLHYYKQVYWLICLLWLNISTYFSLYTNWSQLYIIIIYSSGNYQKLKSRYSWVYWSSACIITKRTRDTTINKQNCRSVFNASFNASFNQDFISNENHNHFSLCSLIQYKLAQFKHLPKLFIYRNRNNSSQTLKKVVLGPSLTHIRFYIRFYIRLSNIFF